MPGSGSLRERKKLDTRHELATMALALAVERGYHGFTVADVTTAVGVSRRTFSNYFASKAECVTAHVDQRLDELIREAEEMPTDAPLAELVVNAFIRAASGASQDAEDFRRLVRTEPELEAVAIVHDERLVQRISVLISRRVALDADDIRIPVLAAFLLRAGNIAMQRWADGGRRGGIAALTHDFGLAFSLVDFGSLPAPLPPSTPVA